MKKGLLILLSVCILGLTGCGTSDISGDATVVKVGVVGEYNAQWDTINELLVDDKIEVELVKFTDYSVPNRALEDGDIDLNAFQHKAYLANEIDTKGYDIVSIGETIIAPLAVFPNTSKIESMSDLTDGSIVAIPSDLTNGGRALKLLEEAGLIVCDPSKGYVPTKADITEYIVQIEIVEAESATLASLLPDVDAAIINGGNAYTAQLNSIEDSIYIETVDSSNDYVDQLKNIIAARSEDQDNEVYLKIVEAYQSSEVETTLEEAYLGAFLPAWK